MKYIDNNEVYTSRACRKSWEVGIIYNMKKILIIILIIVIITLAIIGYTKYNRTYLPKEGEFSESDIYYGCYWGDANQKKAGTPTNWVLVYPGTKSAQWCDPIKAASMER